MSDKAELPAAALIHRLAALLDSAAFDTTYKLATLEALVVVIGSKFTYDQQDVLSVSAREISSHVLARYWDQTANFSPRASEVVTRLRQRGGGRGGDLVSRISQVRVEIGSTSRAESIERARKKAPAVVAALEDLAWERVVDMPIPLLQRSGSGKHVIEDRFLYDYAWSSAGKNQRVSLARRDDTLTLKPGVATALLQFQPLVLRLTEAIWVRLVAEWNPTLTDAGRLYEALFDSSRASNAALVEPLLELQGGACFYCDSSAGPDREVDHFLPRSITRNDRVENLVVACKSCNSKKSDALVATNHLMKWRPRVDESSATAKLLIALADEHGRGSDPAATLAQSRSLYFHAPDSQIVWLQGSNFVSIDKSAASLVLA